MPPIIQSSYKSILFCLIVFCLFSSVSWATDEIAMQTERECAECHLDPAGGGELTAAGESYLAEAIKSGKSSAPNLISKLFRLLIGYIHLVFGIFWFGTILYVHLILKPAYASRGLPRGEKLLGIVSFGVMGVTGSILAWYRVPSLEMLRHNVRYSLNH